MIQTLYSVLAQKALVISRADEEGYEGDSGSDSGSDSNNVETPQKGCPQFLHPLEKYSDCGVNVQVCGEGLVFVSCNQLLLAGQSNYTVIDEHTIAYTNWKAATGSIYQVLFPTMCSLELSF